MVSSDDIELVRQYACDRSEEAFATLVSRHLNLVYSVALRHVANPHQAEEICQAVFMILARKACSLRPGTVLSGWLYHTARLTAANYVRSEIRRTQREQEANMQCLVDEPEPEMWSRLAPLLDQAMGGLNDQDRNAIVLRFFNSKSFQEIGSTLGTSESAAKMRVNRALDKLRKSLAFKGVALSGTALGASLSVYSVQAAPVGLAGAITASVLHTSVTSASLLTLIKGTLKVMAWTKAKTAGAIAVGLLFATGTATVAVKQIQDHRTEPWQSNAINSAMLNQVPPQVRILPTKFPQFAGWGMSDGKVLGIGQTLPGILRVAYGVASPSRVIASTELPQDKYDFIANLPNNSLPALQLEIKRKFGLSARRETRPTDALRLTVKKPGAAMLKVSESEGGSAETDAGRFSCMNQPISCLTSMLEDYFKLPVVDQTGLNEHYDIDLLWEQADDQHQNPDALKQALLDGLGLELVPAKEPIDMLVVERSP